MRAIDIIRRKRDGLENSPAEICFLVSQALERRIPDYQVAAWLMAVYFHGMNEREMTALTETLTYSGEVVDFGDLPGPKVGKHSTGGVGDKTSLIVAPIVASAGVYVPKMSGRGLGHTGGTLDKLESIPGFRTHLSLREFKTAVDSHGIALISQSRDLTPADKMLYALRDVTATVESVPLIVASIISKKVAEGTDGLVLDVKTGRGAFMKTVAEASHLAENLILVGRKMGKRVVAVISDMSQPLGCKIGNALEVQECIETLRSGGPADLRRLCLELAAHMLLIAGKVDDVESGRAAATRQLESGAALEKFRELIESQGGDPRVIEQSELLMGSSVVFEYTAETPGYLGEVRADVLGTVAMLLGAGRETVESTIDPTVGLELLKKAGDRVEKTEPIVRLYYRDQWRLEQALEMLPNAYAFSDRPVSPPVLIHKVIT